MKFKIGVITHDPNFKALFSSLGDKLHCELQFAMGVLDYTIVLAQQMEEHGKVNAIVAHERTASLIAPYVDIPVIPFYIKNSNLMDTFYKCHQMGKRIAFVTMAYTSGEVAKYDLDYVRQVLNYDIRDYRFHDVNEIDDLLVRILEDGCDVIATTAACLCRGANRQGIYATLIEFSEGELEIAIQHAIDILNVKQTQSTQNSWISAVLEHTEHGFITVDVNGVITSVSPVAQHVLWSSPKNLVGQNISILVSLNPAFQKVSSGEDGVEVIRNGEKDLVITKHSIYVGEDYLGCVLKIEVLKNLQWAEMQARKKTTANGFFAHSTFADIVGNSQELELTKQFAKQYALTNSHVLITGESGCGKEIFAQSIHNYSDWREGPFVALNCATLSENLLESELFGYEDGAFTGAKKGGKPGLFELAHGGTLFLDEIGEMPLSLQVKLLRVLQDKVVRRIGGSKNSPINLRIIFATNRDLYQQVQDGNFRQDLYYRVNVLNLKIPPLRQRRDDIAPIAKAIAARLDRAGSFGLEFSPQQLAVMTHYDWPGNVRELQNFVERVSAVCADRNPTNELVSQLMTALSDRNAAPTATAAVAVCNENEISVPIGSMKEMEFHILESLYRRFHGDKARLGYALGLSHTTLWRRLKEANLTVEEE